MSIQCTSSGRGAPSPPSHSLTYKKVFLFQKLFGNKNYQNDVIQVRIKIKFLNKIHFSGHRQKVMSVLDKKICFFYLEELFSLLGDVDVPAPDLAMDQTLALNTEEMK